MKNDNLLQGDYGSQNVEGTYPGWNERCAARAWLWEMKHGDAFGSDNGCSLIRVCKKTKRKRGSHV